MEALSHVVALAGGVGGGKLARGLSGVLRPDQLLLAVNTADDFTHFGLYISPDIDSVLYALADLNDPVQGWGLAGDTDHTMKALAALGADTWFKLYDRDLATHLLRSQKLAEGFTLSEVTALLASRIGIQHTVVPMTDEPVRSIINTPEGALDFQTYFVRKRCEPTFRGAQFEGADVATPNTTFIDAIDRANAIIICPSNPYVSVDPILAMPLVRARLQSNTAPIVAVSPIVGGNAVKGPLAKMMREMDIDVSPVSVVKHYGQLIDGWIIDEADLSYVAAIKKLGFQVRTGHTLMATKADKIRLAQITLDLVSAMQSNSARK